MFCKASGSINYDGFAIHQKQLILLMPFEYRVKDQHGLYFITCFYGARKGKLGIATGITNPVLSVLRHAYQNMSKSDECP